MAARSPSDRASCAGEQESWSSSSRPHLCSSAGQPALPQRAIEPRPCCLAAGQCAAHVPSLWRAEGQSAQSGGSCGEHGSHEPAPHANWWGTRRRGKNSKGLKRFGLPKGAFYLYIDDLYHTLLNMPRYRFLASFFTVYLTLYLAFSFFVSVGGKRTSDAPAAGRPGRRTAATWHDDGAPCHRRRRPVCSTWPSPRSASACP